MFHISNKFRHTFVTKTLNSHKILIRSRIIKFNTEIIHNKFILLKR